MSPSRVPPEIDRAAIVALALTPGIGQKTLGRLLATFGTFNAILAAAPIELHSVRGIGAKTAAAIRTIDGERLSRISAELDRWRSAGISILTAGDPAYPAPLTTLDDAPLVLFARGTHGKSSISGQWQSSAHANQPPNR